jgi:hypothetical protein
MLAHNLPYTCIPHNFRVSTLEYLTFNTMNIFTNRFHSLINNKLMLVLGLPGPGEGLGPCLHPASCNPELKFSKVDTAVNYWRLAGVQA